RLKIGKQRFAVLVKDLRACGNFENGVGAAPARAVLAHAVHADLSLEMLLVAKIDKRIEAFGAFDDDIAAAPAIAAVRAAEFDEFLAAERDASGAAVARTDIDFGLI